MATEACYPTMYTGRPVDASHGGSSSVFSINRTTLTASTDGTHGTGVRRISVFSDENELGVSERGDRVICNAPCNARVTRICNATRKNYIPTSSTTRLRLLSSLNFDLVLLAPFRPDGSREAAKN